MFKIVSYLTILVGVACLPLAEKLYSQLLLSSLVFTLCYLFSQIFNKFLFSKPVRTLFLSISMLLGIIAFLRTERIGEWAVIYLLWYLTLSIQIAIILSPKSPKTWLASYFFSIFHMGLAGEYTRNFIFLLLFPFYIFLLIFSLGLLLSEFEIKREILKFIKPRIEYLKWIFFSTANVFFLTFVIFLILPRTPSPLLKLRREIKIVKVLTKGEAKKFKIKYYFSETLPLGMVSQIKRDRGLLMLVKAKKPLLYRARAFNYFEKGRWSASPNILKRELEIQNGAVQVKPPYLEEELLTQLGPAQFLHQKFYIRGYADNLILGSYQMIKLSRIPAPILKTDALENYYLNRNLSPRISYEVVSIEKDFPADYLRSLPREYPSEIKNLYLQLPAGLDKRIVELTKRVIKGAPFNIYDRVVILRKYLLENYTYSRLNFSGEDALSKFLFEKKEGDCEYFATALALMLRIIKIPARLVVGFSGEEFDPVNKVSEIRPRHAHAWIEVYFPKVGWLTCDAVPGSPYQQQWKDMPQVIITPFEAGLEEVPPEEVPAEEEEITPPEPRKKLIPREEGPAREEGIPSPEVGPEEEAVPEEEATPEEEILAKEELAPEQELPPEEEAVPEQEVAPEEEVLAKEELAPEQELPPEEEAVPEQEVAPEEEVLAKEELAPEQELPPEEEAIPEEEVLTEEEIIPEEIVAKEEILAKKEIVPKEELLPKEEAMPEEILPEEEVLEEEEPTPEKEIAPEEEILAEEELAPEQELPPEEEAVPEQEVAPEEEVLAKEELAPEQELPPEEEAIPEEEIAPEEETLAEEELAPEEEAVLEEKAVVEKVAPEGELLPEEEVTEEEIVEEVVLRPSFIQKLFSLFSSILDWIKEKWHWVLRFSYQTQKLILGKIKSLFLVITFFIKAILNRLIEHLRRHRLLYLISSSYISLLALSLIFVFKVIQRRTERKRLERIIPKRPLTKEERKIANFYFYTLHLLERMGYIRLPYLTPREFAQQIFKKGLRISKELLYLTEMFYRISFGRIQVSPLEIQQVERSVTLIKEWTKETRY